MTRLFYLVVLLLLASPSFAQEDSVPTNFEVMNPFPEGTEAIPRFKHCFPETSADQEEGLKKITRWAYETRPHEGCPPDTLNCRPGIQYYELVRQIRIESSELTYAHLNSILASQRRESCTSPREVSNATPIIEPRRATFRFSGRERVRVCPPWGGSWTVAEGRANIAMGYNLGSDFSLAPFQYVEHQEGELFGFIKGDFAKAILAVFSANFGPIGPAVYLILEDDLFAEPTMPNFMDMSVNVSNSLDKSVLGKISTGGVLALTFVTEQSSSGFRDLGGSVAIDVIEKEYVAGYEEYLLARLYLQTETDFLRQLTQVGPSQHVVKRGDSIWKITRLYYRDPRLHLLISDYAGRRTSLLKPGEVVALPRWDELCDKLKPNDLFVRDGDTLWAKAAAGKIPPDLRKVKTRSGSKDLIYPFEELIVEGNGRP